MNPPKSLRVLAILNLVFGGLGIFGIISSYAMLKSSLFANNPTMQVMNAQPAYAAWLNIALPLGVLATLLLLASGIGLLNARNWARKLALGYGVYAIVVGLVSLVMTYRFVTVPLLEQARNAQGAAAGGAIGGAIVGMLGGVIGLVYPIILVIFMTRPRLVAACTGTPPPMPGA